MASAEALAPDSPTDSTLNSPPGAASLQQQLDAVRTPLDDAQLRRLSTAVQDLSPAGLTWASGYLAGLGATLSGDVLPALPTAANAQVAATLTVLYASQTGNAASIARALADDARSRGLSVQLVSTADYAHKQQLAEETHLLLVCSTQGEGEAPENALEFERFLLGRRAPTLESLHFAVFGLGDSSYEHFCAAARRFDERLAELGATRLQPLTEADVDFDAPGKLWIAQTLDALDQDPGAEPLRSGYASTATAAGPAPQASIDLATREHPQAAELVEHRLLTTDEAVTDVHHLVLAVDPDGFRYEPGDSLGLAVDNDTALIAQLLEALALDGAAPVTLEGVSEPSTLESALREHLEITLLHPSVVSAWAALPAQSAASDEDALAALVDDRQALRDFAASRQLIDLALDHPRKVDADTLVALLKRKQPRLYSIASSQQNSDDEIHLTVSALRYDAHGRAHQGAASCALADRLGDGDTVPAWIVANEHFRLPADDVPIIMIGAGTGIAPFRAFMQAREARSASGDNWLIFGNRRFHDDFLYQRDWLAWNASSLLTRATLAFSRDSEQRVYVQDRIREQAEELRAWIARGAVIYVCGAIAMEQGVRDALHDVLTAGTGVPAEPGTDDDPLEQLRRDGRYRRDVY